MPKSKLIVALDMDSLGKAEELVSALKDSVSVFKVGSRLFTSCGAEVIRRINAQGAKVFLDLKFHDIPSVTASAVRAAQAHGVFALSLHTLGGMKMLEECAKIKMRPLLWGVTVLTSMDDDGLRRIGIEKNVRDEVLSLVSLARDAGLDGIVCSPREIEDARERAGKNFTIVTPGIRPFGSAKDDQARTMTAREATGKGSDYIVVGRPVVEAKDPLEAVRGILKEIS